MPAIVTPDNAQRMAAMVLAERKKRADVEELKNSAARSLRVFIEQAWHVIEPATPFIGGWNLDAVCDHLQAVSEGHIRNLVINVPPRTSKPCATSQPVLERTKGRILLGEVIVGDEVLTHKGRFRRVLEVHEQGELPLVGIKTHGGRTALAAYDHPFLTPRGWVNAGQLSVDDSVATVHPQESCGSETMSLEEARLLGYLIGDGCCKYKTVGITNEDQAVLGDIEKCAVSLGFFTRRSVRPGCSHASVFLNAKPSGENWWPKDGPHPVRTWVAKHELTGADSYSKRVPPAIMAGTMEIVAEFLGAYWSCDGHIEKRGRVNGGRKRSQIACSTVSEGLARDVQHLLTRLGIDSRVRRRQSKLKSIRQGDLYVSWMVAVGNIDQGSKFASVIPVRHKKGELLLEYSRTTFDRVLNEDPIIEIFDAGHGECRCLTIEEDSSFTVSDIAVHNSTIVSVLWPAWAWINKPELRWLFSSYTSKLSLRDSMKCRRVIDSKWYRNNWGHIYHLIGDQNTKENYENDKTGQRIATSVSGIGVGAGGDFVICDDPNSVEMVESDVMRQNVLDWWDHTMSTRGNNPKTVVRVIVQQRLHEMDLSGHVLAQGGYTHLFLPMRFEEKRRCRTVVGEKSWEDPREKHGDLLWPERFGEKEIVELETRLGSYMSAGQLQQNPTPAGGGILKSFWWRYWQPAGAKMDPVPVSMPDGSTKLVSAIELPAKFDLVLSSWDMAFKDLATSDYVVGVVMAARGANRFILDLDRGHYDLPKTLLAVRKMSAKHRDAYIKLVEDKANGPAVIQSLQATVGGFIAVNPIGGKISRAAAESPAVESGNWYLPHPLLADWVTGFIDEAAAFPKAAHDDQVDSWSQGAARLKHVTPLGDEDTEFALSIQDRKLGGWSA